MNADRDVVEFVGSGRIELPAEVAARLERALRADSVGSRAGVRPGHWFAVVTIAAGVLVALGVAWLRREPVAQSANVPSLPPQLQGGPQEPAKEGPPLALDETRKRAAVIAVVDVFFPSGVLAEDGVFGKVTRVLHGDAAVVGQELWLHWNPETTPSTPCCLDQFDLAADRAAPGKHWLMALVPMSPAEVKAAGPTRTLAWVDKAAKLRWFHSPFTRGLAGTPVSKAGGEPSVAGELLAAIRQPAGSGRRLALSALADLHGIAEPDAKSPWCDVAIVRELARLSLDSDADLRVELAAALPFVEGDAEVQAALRRLLFDRVAAVRWGMIQRIMLQTWFLQACDDAWWTAMSWPGSFRSLAISAEIKARQEGVTTPIGVWERQLNKERAENQLLGALGLAAMRDAAALPGLVALANHADVRVRAAAAGGRITLGDRQGYGELRLLLRDGDALAGVCALDVVRRQATAETFDLLRLAAASEHDFVRALAAAGLAEQREQAPHEVDQLLTRLGADDAEIVRVAAATVPLVVSQPWRGVGTSTPR